MAEEEDNIINEQMGAVERVKIPNLTPAEAAWYDSLDEGDLKQLSDSYFDKVHDRRGPIKKVTYASFVKVCAAVAVKLHAGISKREARGAEKLAKLARDEEKRRG